MANTFEEMLSSLARPGCVACFVQLVKEGCKYRNVEFTKFDNVYHVVQDLIALELITKVENKFVVTPAGFERNRQSEYLNRKIPGDL